MIWPYLPLYLFLAFFGSLLAIIVSAMNIEIKTLRRTVFSGGTNTADSTESLPY